MLVEKIRVSNEVLQTLPKVKVGYCKMYSCEYPIKSPECKDIKGVIQWYCELGEKEKLMFKKSDGFIVSELNVALMDVEVSGEVYHRGDVIKETDACKFDYRKGIWVNLRN